MTSQVLTRRRLLAFGGVAIVVGAIVGLAATRGGRQGAQSQSGTKGPLDTLAIDEGSSSSSSSKGLDASAILEALAAARASANESASPIAAASGAVVPGSPAAAAQQQPPPQQLQSNLEKLLNGAAMGGSSTGSEALFGNQLAVNYVEVAGCTPEDGMDLTRIVEETSCPIITLKPGFNYSIETNIVVRRRVTIVGRPLGMPIIDAHNASRAFLVEGTGALDVRFCRIIKGTFIEVIPLVEYHMRGPTAYVMAGGSLNLFGCEVTVNPILALRASGFTPPQTNLRAFGGGVTAEGGVVRATDCVFWSVYPGFIARESQFIGGDFLMVAGTLYLTGCQFFQMTMFANAIGGGGYVANFGGNIVITGCLFGYASGFVSLSGLGFLFFNGAGTMIVTGSEVATNIAVAAFFGGGIGMFTGGGVGITTGFIYSDVGVFGIACGVGFQQAVGGGVNVRVGVIQSSMGSQAFVAGVGISTYVGGGVGVSNTAIFTRASAISSFYGTAVNFFVGSGVATIVNILGGFSNCIGAAAFVGGDVAVMTGWLTRSVQLYASVSAIQFVAGQGADTFVGPGGAALSLNAYMLPKVPVSYSTPGMALIYVTGSNIITFNKVGNALVAFNLVGLKRGVFDYHNNIFIARELSWILAQQLQGQVRDRALPARPEQVTMDADAVGGIAGHNYNHLPIEEALDRFRSIRRSLPTVPVPRNALQPAGRRARRTLLDGGVEEGARATYDVRRLVMEATKGLADGTLAKKYGDSAAATTTATTAHRITSTDAEGAAVVADPPPAPDAAAFNRTGPWFYFANHPALQVEGTPKTDKIYVAAKNLQACSVCGLSSEESAATGGNIDGPGAGSCRADDACGTEQGAAGAASAGQPEFTRMWVTDREAALPNTTVTTLFLKATFTPGRLDGGQGDYTTVSEGQVAAALNATLRELGLPSRLHLRVERASTHESIDPMFKGPDVPEYLKEGTGAPARRRLKAMRAAQRRRLQEEMGEVAGQQECGRNELFKAYVVSDWKNVTDAVARGIRSSEAEQVLTRLLQEHADVDAAEGRSPVAYADDPTYTFDETAEDGVDAAGTGADAVPATPPAVCTLVAYRTASIHIPAASIAGLSTATPLPTRYTLPGMDGSAFAESHPEGLDADDVDAGLDPMSRLTLQAAPSLALVLPPSPAEHEAARALEAEAARRRARRLQPQSSPAEPSDEPVSGLRELPPRAQEVAPGKTYSVMLQNFAPGQLLSLRLVPEAGADVPLSSAPILSAPAAFSRQQLWSWTVPATVPPGKYFLEATSQRMDAFAYSQAFTVLGA